MNPNPQIGDRVRIVDIPAEVFSDWNKFPETTEIFHKARGRTFTVRGLNDDGFAELWVNDDGTENTTGDRHSIWVEPEYLAIETE